MVETAGAKTARALDAPIAVRVEADAGWPIALVERGARSAVESVEDLWRVEDEGSRRTPVSRTYFEVLIEDGRRLSIYHDHVSDEWRSRERG